jgi:pimeloyl-ACP methyl ester carboxylesterase
MSSALHDARPRVLLIHGSAADHTTWSIQLASSLRDRFRLIAYDRRVGATLTIEDHAADAAERLAGEPGRALVVGSSFGAVVALEVARRHAALCAGIVLIEPPLPPSDDAPPAIDLLARLDARAAGAGPVAAAELFLRSVLGDAAYERMPRAYRERSQAMWAAIRADTVALLAYRPRYAQLAAMTVPALLLGGARSAAYFRPTLDALARALPNARLEIVPNAGHMLHAEAFRRFDELLVAFAASIGFGGAVGKLAGM